MGVWDELGFRGIDPDINERIKKHLSKQGSQLESRISTGVLRQAANIVSIRTDKLSEYISGKEILARFKSLRRVGYPVSGYSNMNSSQLYRYFKQVRGDILQQSRVMRTS